jgi:hypothetical protein
MAYVRRGRFGASLPPTFGCGHTEVDIRGSAADDDRYTFEAVRYRGNSGRVSDHRPQMARYHRRRRPKRHKVIPDGCKNRL